MEIFDIEQDRSCLVQIVHHIVDGGTAGGCFVGGTEKLAFCRALHRRTTLAAADVLQGRCQQIELKHKLPHMLVFPCVDVDLRGSFDNALNIGRIVS